MNLDDLLRRAFGTAELGDIPPAALSAGTDRLLVEFALETDRARRFALWCVLSILGEAPEIEAAFKEESDREAARKVRDLLAEEWGR
jgi:hypothetical protein